MAQISWMTPQARIEVQAPGASRFRARLLSVMDRKDHPSYWRLMGPGATRSQLQIHYLQEWGVYVRDFPVYLSRIHAGCPEPDVRQELAENLYEEETGKISGGGPHSELFLHMMEGLGFDRRDFDSVRLLPESRAYREFLDRATLRAPWLVGLAVATIFVEGSRNDREEVIGSPALSARKRPGAKGSASGRGQRKIDRIENWPRAATTAAASRNSLENDPLVVNHGLDPRFLELKRVHRKVEGGHRLSAWRAVLAHAKSPEHRELVVSAMERALVLWLAYREGVARAAALR